MRTVINNWYYYFPSVISPEMCNKIIKYGNSLQEETARTGAFAESHPMRFTPEGKNTDLTEEQLKKLKTEQRDSNVSWISEQWLYDILNPYVRDANKKANWNYDYDYVEPIQFTKYKLNQFYNWHCDNDFKTYDRPNEPNVHGKIRKLSAIVFLSDPSKYVGGQLKIDTRDNPVGCNILEITQNTQGSIVVFPSGIWHKVFPVVSGERYSLVAWYLGKPFR